MMRRPFLYVMPFLLALAPGSAWALACTVLGEPVGQLYDVGPICSTAGSSLNGTGIFSRLSCTFQSILNVAMSHIYCGFQYNLATTVYVAMLLFVVIYAVMFTAGMTQLNAKEVTSRLIKMALVYLFATQASAGVDLTYTFIIGTVDTMIGWVMSAADPAGTCYNPVAIKILDCLLFQQLVSPFTASGSRVMAFFAALSYAMPPVFLLFTYFMYKSITIFVRALIVYLLGISAIAFLVSVGPIFVSMALFKSTYGFFESWIRYLISFALQIVLIFASIAVLFFALGILPDFFAQLAGIIKDYNSTWWAGPTRTEHYNAIGICPATIGVGFGASLTCISSDIIPPSRWIFQAELIYFIIVNLLVFTILIFAFDTLIANIPELARQLSGPKYAPMLGGGKGLGAVKFPGSQMAENARAGFTKGFNDEAGYLHNKVAAGGREASKQTIRNIEDMIGRIRQAQDAKGRT